MKRNDYGRQRAQWSSPRNDESAQDYEPTRQRASNRFEERNARDDRQRERLDRKQVEKPAYPLSIPHTTAASQFLYGYSTVYAALRAGRRRCYKLYLHTRGATRDGSAGDDKYKLQKLASAAKIQIVQCGDGDTRLLDKMSEGRPHNGIVLEAAPLPIPPITNLKFGNEDTSAISSHTQLRVTHSNGEDQVYTVYEQAPFTNLQYIPPVVLLIDDVLDPGNLGGILRSAYFLGVSAVLLTGHVAPLNAVTLKASAGAAEALHLFRLDNPSDMLRRAAKGGVGILCATTPTERPGKAKRQETTQLHEVKDDVDGVRYLSHDQSIEDGIGTFLDAKPQILIIGGEGRGLRPFITKEADTFIEVASPRQKEAGDVGLDSLNVSVAAGIVVQEVMTKMRTGRRAVEQNQQMKERKLKRENHGGNDVEPQEGQASNDDKMF